MGAAIAWGLLQQGCCYSREGLPQQGALSHELATYGFAMESLRLHSTVQTNCTTIFSSSLHPQLCSMARQWPSWVDWEPPCSGEQDLLLVYAVDATCMCPFSTPSSSLHHLLPSPLSPLSPFPLHPPSPSLPPPKDEYKSYLPMWRQEMKDNKIIKCPNFEVKSVCCSNPYSLVPRPRGRRESPSLLPRSLGTRLQPLWHLTSVSF